MEISSKQEHTLYEAVGGEEFFHRLVEGFYSQVKEDDIIGPMYPDDDWEGAQNRLRWFLAQYWGGPRTYQEQRGNPMLRRRHFPFAIGEEFASKWQFLPYIERGIHQFNRLDVCNVGGLTEAMKVAAMSEAHYVDLMPHNPLFDPIPGDDAAILGKVVTVMRRV